MLLLELMGGFSLAVLFYLYIVESKAGGCIITSYQQYVLASLLYGKTAFFDLYTYTILFN